MDTLPLRQLAIGDRVEFRRGGFAWVIDPGNERRLPLLVYKGGRLKRRVATTTYHYAPPKCEIEAVRDRIKASWSPAERRQRMVGIHTPKAAVPRVPIEHLPPELLDEVA